ncbi:MAG: hypothetical protein AAGC55_06390 [Myxococcota bacterium]
MTTEPAAGCAQPVGRAHWLRRPRQLWRWSGPAWLVLLIIAAIVGACTRPPHAADSRELFTADQAELPGCTLMVRKCSRCHEIERIIGYRVSSPVQWRRLVDRMQRLRGSGIAPDDGAEIADCLIRRQFGASRAEADLPAAGSTELGGDASRAMTGDDSP